MKDQQKVFKGFWNGEPATFRVVNIIVGYEPKEKNGGVKKCNGTAQKGDEQ